MADNKKSIVVYADWIEKFEELTDDEAGRLIKHFFRYVNDLNPEAPDRITKLSFISIKQALKRDLDKWERTLEGRSKAGKASAEKRRLNKLAQQSSTNPTSVESVEKNPTNPTDSVNVSVNVNDTVIKKKVKKVFIPPTKKEFMVFARTKFPTEEAYQKVRDKLLLKFDSWDESDWINGRTDKPIKKWKSTLLNTIPHL